MKLNNLISKWQAAGPYTHSLLRITSAFMFIQSGTMKLFSFPIGMPEGVTAGLFSQIWIGGVLELVGGALLLLGLYARPVAFILSGEMAVAYFQFHAQQNFWQIINGGIPAVLYCFIWLYFSATGSGPWSVDSLLLKRKQRANNC
ncbi:MAG: DoxX family protein [Ignavibacteria bacterium]|nr:DoxX family protein [Ignavibacteria bacterium]